MGITGKILKCIGNFLHCRQQRVVVESVCSSWSYVSSGMPQGSVLSHIISSSISMIYLAVFHVGSECMEMTLSVFQE